MLNDPVSAASPDETSWLQPSPGLAEPKLESFEDVNVMALRDLILDLAGLEHDLRGHRSARPSPDSAEWLREWSRLTSRQRLVARELRHRARRRPRLRPGRLDRPTAPGDPGSVPQLAPPPEPFAPPFVPLAPTG